MTHVKRFVVVVTAVLGVGAVLPAQARAQAFTEASRGLVNYRLSEYVPRAACDAFTSSVKVADVVSLQAREVPAADGAPVALPSQRRDCARGGVRGQPARAVERPLLHDRQRRPCGAGPRRSGPHHRASRGPAARLRVRHHQHRPRRAQGTGRELRDEQPAKGHRLRLPCGACDGGGRQGHRQGLLRAAGGSVLLELLLERRTAGPDRSPALPRRLRRHRRQRAVGGADQFHDWRDVEPAGVDRGPPVAREDGARRQPRDGHLRCRGRAGRRPDRRPARLQVRPRARRARVRRRHRRRRTA